MASTICGWCGKASRMTPVAAFSGSLKDKSGITQVAYSCDFCLTYNLAIVYGRSDHESNTGVNDRFVEGSEEVLWLPRRGDSVTYDDVPPHIAKAASEAHECHSIGAHRAAIILARAVIEASAKEKGITSGHLIVKIDEMVKQGFIRQLVADAAHGVRLFGNDMAHGDFGPDVSDEDADETLALMAVVLNEVFQIEARTKALRDRAIARKA